MKKQIITLSIGLILLGSSCVNEKNTSDITIEELKDRIEEIKKTNVKDYEKLNGVLIDLENILKKEHNYKSNFDLIDEEIEKTLKEYEEAKIILDSIE